MNKFSKLFTFCLLLVFPFFTTYISNYIFDKQEDKKWDSYKFQSNILSKNNSNITISNGKNASGSSNDHFDVTFVSQASFNRWSFMMEIARRWKGPMSICYYLLKEEVPEFQSRLAEASLRDNIHLEYRIQTNASYYPVNALRNIAISQVRTSHFYLSDMDVWPSDTTYDAIIKLDPSILANETLAIIVPAFQVRMQKCPSFEECTKSYRMGYPSSKLLLNTCLRSRRCTSFRPREYLHDYYTQEWFYSNKQVLPVTCFKSDTQEPYIVVKKTAKLPLFSEEFVNYSYNKVQWIEHLRWVGYSFSVLVEGYSVDIPHPESPYRQQFFKELKATRVFPMMDTYHAFLDRLNQTVPKAAVVELCPKAHINPRKIVFYSDNKK